MEEEEILFLRDWKNREMSFVEFSEKYNGISHEEASLRYAEIMHKHGRKPVDLALRGDERARWKKFCVWLSPDVSARIAPILKSEDGYEFINNVLKYYFSKEGSTDAH